MPDTKPHDLYWSIQQLVTRRNALVKAQGALKNQLHIQLSHHYPSYKKFFSEVDGKTALAFWKQYPSPSSLDGVNVKKLTTLLLEASNNTCSVKKANEILKKKEMNYMEAELKQLMSLPDFQLDSMPGIDLVTASALSWADWKGHSKMGEVPVIVRMEMLEKEKQAREALKIAIEERLKK